ncbi:transporter [Streptomyces sp. 150FB]|uniref:FtsX-like permease family protein n=1 Tax=Streptomyces sp. 150FB TaxID=1576605 RepID=UPI000588F4DD|nr:FtsX-like permease family protein [Streptomyces sp. 150FB]KIF76644.1 transporter [Streptomyces sp. 150FB]
MFALAMRSVRKRPGRSVATLLAAFLGATITMTFFSLQDTAGAPATDAVSAETLSITAGVVGGYGSLLVFFAIASTLTVNVRQRGEEIALLRRTGATPAQLKRMIVGEAAVVAVVATLLAVWPAMLGGEALLGVFQDSGQVAHSVDHVFGPLALSAGFSVTLIASAGAALLAVRRATKAAAGSAGSAGAPRNRLRNTAGFAALLIGVGGLGTTFAIDPAAPALMAAPTWGAIMLSVGFATFSPSILRGLLGVLRWPITMVAGASGYLTVRNMRRRATQLAGVLMPLILFTGVATATLYIQAVESDAITASGIAKSVDDKNVETVNLVVVGIIVVFSCIMLINSLYAATSYRGREFGQQRLAGATPKQVLGMVGTEGVLLTLIGVFFGTVAGAAGLLAFTAVRTDQVVPDQSLAVWIGITAVGAAATLLTSLGTARRVLRVPAIVAVA